MAQIGQSRLVRRLWDPVNQLPKPQIENTLHLVAFVAC